MRRGQRLWVIAIAAALLVLLPAVGSAQTGEDETVAVFSDGVWQFEMTPPTETNQFGTTTHDPTIVRIARVEETNEFTMAASSGHTNVDDRYHNDAGREPLTCSRRMTAVFEGSGTFDPQNPARIVIVGREESTDQILDCGAGAVTVNEWPSQEYALTISDEGLSGGFSGTAFVIPGPIPVPFVEGVTERDGNLYLDAPAGGVLELTRADLPEWARGLIVVEGAIIATVGPPDRVAGGDPTVLIDGLAVARLGDPTQQGGVVVGASSQIFVNGVPVAVVGSETVNPMVTAMIPHVGGPIATTQGLSNEEAAALATAIANQAPLTAADGRALDRLDELRQAYEFQKRKVWLLHNDYYVGQLKLELEAAELEVGAIISITDPTGNTSEIVRVADKGSIILDQPLENTYPAGSFIITLDEETSDLFRESNPNEPAVNIGETENATDSVVADSSSSALPVVLGVVVAVAGTVVVGAVMWKRRSTSGT